MLGLLNLKLMEFNKKFTQSLHKELVAHLEQVGALDEQVEELDGADSRLQQTVLELRHDYSHTQGEIEVG